MPAAHRWSGRHAMLVGNIYGQRYFMQRVRRFAMTKRIIAISAGICLLFALGCGLIGLAVRQRVIMLADSTMQLGPLSIITHAPRSSICPEKADPLKNVCDRFSATPGPASYRIWLFWSTPEHGPRSTRVLAHWILPLPDQSRN